MQVMKEGAPAFRFPWWGPEGNEALLRAYHKRGVFLYRKNRQLLRAFAEDVIEASHTDVDFTVRVCINQIMCTLSMGSAAQLPHAASHQHACRLCSSQVIACRLVFM